MPFRNSRFADRLYLIGTKDNTPSRMDRSKELLADAPLF